jgi:hypothetical protein
MTSPLETVFPSQGALFTASFAMNLILSMLTLVVFALLGRSLALICAMLVCTLGFQMPTGLVALSARTCCTGHRILGPDRC